MQFKSVSPGQFSRRITNTPVTSLCAYKKYFNHVLEIVILDPLNPRDLNLMLAASLLFVVRGISFPSLFFFSFLFFFITLIKISSYLVEGLIMGRIV